MPNQSDMKMETTLSNEQIQLFKLCGVTIRDNNGTAYYHLPQYFKDLGAGEFEVMYYNQLPEDIKKRLDDEWFDWKFKNQQLGK